MVACQPPANKLEGAKYEKEAVDHCFQHLKLVVQRYKPKVIIALGGVAFKKLTGLTDRKVTPSRGYLYDSPHFEGIKILPSFHPSFIARNGRKLLNVLKRDIATAFDYVEGRVPPFVTNHELHDEQKGMQKVLRILEENPNKL